MKYLTQSNMRCKMLRMAVTMMAATVSLMTAGCEKEKEPEEPEEPIGFVVTEYGDNYRIASGKWDMDQDGEYEFYINRSVMYGMVEIVGRKSDYDIRCSVYDLPIDSAMTANTANVTSWHGTFAGSFADTGDYRIALIRKYVRGKNYYGWLVYVPANGGIMPKMSAMCLMPERHVAFGQVRLEGYVPQEPDTVAEPVSVAKSAADFVGTYRLTMLVKESTMLYNTKSAQPQPKQLSGRLEIEPLADGQVLVTGYFPFAEFGGGKAIYNTRGTYDSVTRCLELYDQLFDREAEEMPKFRYWTFRYEPVYLLEDSSLSFISNISGSGYHEGSYNDTYLNLAQREYANNIR